MLPLCPATTGASLCSDATPTARSCVSLSRRRGYRGRQCARCVCRAIGRPGGLFCEDPAQSRIRDVQVTGSAQSARRRWTIFRTPFRLLTRRGPTEAHFAAITTPEFRRIGHRIVALCDLETGRRPPPGPVTRSWPDRARSPWCGARCGGVRDAGSRCASGCRPPASRLEGRRRQHPPFPGTAVSRPAKARSNEPPRTFRLLAPRAPNKNAKSRQPQLLRVGVESWCATRRPPPGR